MTKKEIRKVEEVVEKVLDKMLREENYVEDDDDETSIPMSIIEQMEDYLGEPILFMAIT